MGLNFAELAHIFASWTEVTQVDGMTSQEAETRRRSQNDGSAISDVSGYLGSGVAHR